MGVKYSFAEGQNSLDVYSQVLSGERVFNYVGNLRNVKSSGGGDFKFPGHNFYLYACWKPNEYEVNFEYDNMSYTTVEINDLQFDSSLGMMNILSKKAGYKTAINLPLASDINKTIFVTYDDVKSVERDSSGNPVRVEFGDSSSTNSFSIESSGIYAGLFYYTKQVSFGGKTFDLKYYVGVSEDRAWSVFLDDTDLANQKVTLKNSQNIDGQPQVVDANVYPQKVSFEKEGNIVNYETSIDEDGRYYFVDVDNGRKYVSRQLIRPDGYEFSHYKINGNAGYGANDLFVMGPSNPDFNDLGQKISVTVVFKKLNVVVTLNNNDNGVDSAKASKEVYPGTEVFLPTMYNSGEFE